MTQSSTPPGELVHYGVKGMHWGARKARTGDLQKKIGRLDRVAGGTGSLRDKVVTVGQSKPVRLVSSGGLKNEAARRSQLHKEEVDRLAKGHATIKDLLKVYGTVSVVSLARSVKD